MTVYVIGDNPSRYVEEMGKFGYRIANCDVGAPVKEMLPMRIGLMLQADRAYLAKEWENNPVYRAEYSIAEEFKLKFIRSAGTDCDRVIIGKHLEVIRGMAELICKLYDGKTVEEVFVSKTEKRNLERVLVKHVVFYILKQYGFSVIHISKAIPNTGRGDVYHGFKAISGYISVDRSFRLKVPKLIEALYNSGYVNTYVYT